jgi:pyridoxamine 5'-phosphate oxidase family protein
MFTDGEYHNLTTRRRGRLTTLGPGERTHVHPVPSIVDNRTGCIEIGGRHLGDTQKYRNIRRDPRVSLVVDDGISAPLQLDERGGRGIETRRIAEASESARPTSAGFDTEIIRIHPVHIDSWNLDDPGRPLRQLRVSEASRGSEVLPNPRFAKGSSNAADDRSRPS